MEYYLLSIKWTWRDDFVFTFWCPNSSGYTYFKHKAGLYEYSKAFSIAHGNHFEGAFPVPKEIVDELWTEVVYEREYHPQNGSVIINNSYTRSLLRIDPFWMHSGDRGCNRSSFDILYDCKWIRCGMENTELIRSDKWNILIKDPAEPSEFGSQGIVHGGNYREARKEAYKVVESMYGDGDFILTMNRFTVKRIIEERLVDKIHEHPWGEG